MHKEALQEIPSGPADPCVLRSSVKSMPFDVRKTTNFWSHWAWELAEGKELRSRIEAVEGELGSVQGEIPQLEQALFEIGKNVVDCEEQEKAALKDLER